MVGCFLLGTYAPPLYTAEPLGSVTVSDSEGLVKGSLGSVPIWRGVSPFVVLLGFRKEKTQTSAPLASCSLFRRSFHPITRHPSSTRSRNSAMANTETEPVETPAPKHAKKTEGVLAVAGDKDTWIQLAQGL